jgi:LmbE family N-acetylglucosaminyl deacetylase
MKRIKMRTSFLLLCLIALATAVSFGQPSEAPPSLPPHDARYKADILLIMAHPDDEEEISGYLAQARDEHKRIAVLFATRGDTGANLIGWAKENALGAEREIEARNALEVLGIKNAWFIGAPDTPSQDVLWSLERWNHGSALEQTVRIIRLTRPDVIISMLPAYYTGEDHGDHQAAGVIATEAFDMAGDPTKFPAQIVAPSVRAANYFGTEGLRLWQPKKIYFIANPDTPFSESQDQQGPEYPITGLSPSRHVTYCQLHYESLDAHRTQYAGQPAEALKSLKEGKDISKLCEPERLILGKSLVGGSVSGDVFQRISPGPIAFVPVKGFQPETRTGLSLELGAQFAFYRKFWVAHDIERLANLMPIQEMSVAPGGNLPVPLLLRNDTDRAEDVDLTADLPSGWAAYIWSSKFPDRGALPVIKRPGTGQFPVRAHDQYPVQETLTAPASGKVGEWHQITWRARSAGKLIGTVTIKVYLEGVPGMAQ